MPSETLFAFFLEAVLSLFVATQLRSAVTLTMDRVAIPLVLAVALIGTVDALPSRPTPTPSNPTPSPSPPPVAVEKVAAPPPPYPPPLIATAHMVVTADLTLVGDLMGTDTEAAFKAKLLPTVARAAGIEESAVNIKSVAKTSRRRNLLASGVKVSIDATYGVDDTAPTRQLATAKAVAFITKSRYKTSSLLPDSMANAAHTGVTTLDAPAAVGLVCPPAVNYAAAAKLVDEAKHEEAKRALNDLLICAHKTNTGLNDTSMADNYNLLGFTNRKLASPDVELSEIYYKQALKISPNHVAARGYLGELYVQMDKPAEAREVLDKLKSLCPPPTGCESLDYLRRAMAEAGDKFTEGAFVKEVQWSDCFNEKCSPTNITLGDSIDFRYDSSHHNVVKVENAAEYKACSAKTNVMTNVPSSSTGYVHKFDTLGAHYFVCGVGSHCESGQKMIVNVFKAKDVASTGGKANNYSRDRETSVSSAHSPAAVFLTVLAAGAMFALM